MVCWDLLFMMPEFWDELDKDVFCMLRLACKSFKAMIPERDVIMRIFKGKMVKKVDLFRILPLSVNDVIRIRSPVDFTEAFRISERKAGGLGGLRAAAAVAAGGAAGHGLGRLRRPRRQRARGAAGGGGRAHGADAAVRPAEPAGGAAAGAAAVPAAGVPAAGPQPAGPAAQVRVPVAAARGE